MSYLIKRIDDVKIKYRLSIHLMFSYIIYVEKIIFCIAFSFTNELMLNNFLEKIYNTSYEIHLFYFLVSQIMKYITIFTNLNTNLLN